LSTGITAGRRNPALFDTRSGSTFMLSHTARHPVSLGGALFFDDGPESNRRLYQVDFARGAANPVQGLTLGPPEEILPPTSRSSGA
jgi:hypothetical protein